MIKRHGEGGAPLLALHSGPVAGVTLGIVLCACLAGCTSRTETTSADTPLTNEPARSPDSIQLTPEQTERLRIVAAEKQNWSVDVGATGTVDWDTDHTTAAITQVGGPVTRIVADVGEFVQPGQPLVYISSPDVVTAIASYRKARNRLIFQKQQLERSRDLLEHSAIARKDYESVQADYNDAATEVQNNLQPLKIFGITEKEIEDSESQGVAIRSELAVRSPIAGTIVQKLISPGQLVQAGATSCFLVSDTRTVWVQGHLYEKDLTAVKVGDSVDMTNSALPGVFHGTVSYIGAMIDPATRTTPLRIVTRNPDGLLKKDLFLDLVVHTSIKRGILTIPESSVLHDPDNQPYVFLQAGDRKFQQKRIAMGLTQNKRVQVTGGLQEGERVVAEGSIFLANSMQR